MMHSTRRAFLGGMGGGAFTLGTMGLSARRAFALAFAGGGEALTFGALDPLASLMQEKAPDVLQPLLIDRIESGTSLATLVAAGTLANARAFGGQDYIGYHCTMAMIPAWEMSQQMRGPERALPVLKVLYRNAARIQECGGRAEETLRALGDVAPSTNRTRSVKELRAAFLERDYDAAEHVLAALTADASAEDAYNDVQCLLRENLDVHRVVLAWRAWDVMRLTGNEHARTLLRQIVRFCIQDEERRIKKGKPEPALRALLPALVERHGLTKQRNSRHASDAEVAELAQVVFASGREEAAAATAEALGGGMSHHDVGEALSIAANTLLINDPGRSRSETGKPKGSVHGASVGVHAADSARAWRNIATVSNHGNAVGNLIAGAYHTAGQKRWSGDKPLDYARHFDQFENKTGDELLGCVRAAIEDGNQSCACAAAHCYLEKSCPPRPLFDLLIRYAASEDGALHAEKYYYTVCEEFDSGRPAFRNRQLVTLARVTASEYGFPAPGYEAARARLVG